MKGKSVRRRPESVVSDYVDIPEEILGMNTYLKVSVDVMFVNKSYFLVCVSKWIKLTKTKYILNRPEK